MGIYINPGNAAFAEINDSDYVDKTGMIELINQSIGTNNKLTCISRPRRFGKSYAAKMLTAYYDCSCDSHELFEGKTISRKEDYEKHLNNYNVIYLDITSFLSNAKASGVSYREVPALITKGVLDELIRMDETLPGNLGLENCLIRYAEKQGQRKFIFIIDEWDALIREAAKDKEAQMRYLNLLRGWFKNANFTPRAVAAAYMTGILPIKKDGSQSAISDFNEYTMVKPRFFGEYAGFTEAEVKSICREKSVSFDIMKQWYDGYHFKDVGSVYNPNSVMKAVRFGDFDSYWTETSAAEGLMEYIGKDYNGLTKTFAELIGGVEIPLDTIGFANDLTTFRGKDDVLTLLVHLGYLAYDSEKQTVCIPNEEIRREFQRSVREVRHEETRKRLEESELLFKNTLLMNESAVAAQIEKVHNEESAPLHYNREDSLRSVIKLAYYTYRDHYLQFEELPAGTGYADVVYIPKPDSDWPALVVELKWNQSADGAIDQILKKQYPSALEGLNRPILLVGIAYSKDSGDKKHTCRIIRA